MDKNAPHNIPQKVGYYRILSEVGAGGLGRVYRAVDERSGQTVAIKFLHDKYLRNKKFLGIFHRELMIASGLHHKHVVSYLDSCFEPPLMYIVSEFVEGWSVYQFLKRVGPLPPMVALAILIDMLQGVDYLHLHDTVHSDLSSPNVLIDRAGRVLVTDFGLAATVDVEDYRNYMIGTPGYYSPEHIQQASILPQSDLYCAGLILFEMITGKKAVQPSNDRRKMLARMGRIDFGQITSPDRRLEQELRRFLKSSLALRPSGRFAGTDAMMFSCYQILKRYEIRYARHCIKKFLIDRAMVDGPFKGQEQNIYAGLGAG